LKAPESDAASSDDEFATGEGLSTVEILRQPADLTGERMRTSVARQLKHIEGSEEESASSPSKSGGIFSKKKKRGGKTKKAAGDDAFI
jgi:hypothetical protein